MDYRSKNQEIAGEVGKLDIKLESVAEFIEGDVCTSGPFIAVDFLPASCLYRPANCVKALKVKGDYVNWVAAEFGIAVMMLAVSTKLFYVEPGL